MLSMQFIKAGLSVSLSIIDLVCCTWVLSTHTAGLKVPKLRYFPITRWVCQVLSFLSDSPLFVPFFLSLLPSIHYLLPYLQVMQVCHILFSFDVLLSLLSDYPLFLVRSLFLLFPVCCLACRSCRSIMFLTPFCQILLFPCQVALLIIPCHCLACRSPWQGWQTPRGKSATQPRSASLPLCWGCWAARMWTGPAAQAQWQVSTLFNSCTVWHQVWSGLED
jgi:hypothetical protein